MGSMGLWAALWPVLLCAGQGAPHHLALPPPTRYVADYAGLIDTSHESELNGLLQRLEMTTGVQYIIVTIQSLKGESLAWFAKKTAVLWKLRQQRKDKGVLFVLVADDKTYRFEVGQDLRGVLTEQYLAQIGEDLLRPCIEAGKAGEGVYQCNLRVVGRIAREYGVQVSDSTQALPRQVFGSQPLTRNRSWTGWGSILLVLLSVVLLGTWLSRRIRRSRRASLGSSGFGAFPGHGQGGPYGGGCFGGGAGAFGAGFGGSGAPGTSGLR